MENYCAYCMAPRKGNFCGFCGHKAGAYSAMPHHLQPGTVLANKYLVGRVLGEGGFGITYIGLDQLLGLKVAIKEYYPSGLVNRNHTATSAVSANLGDAQAPFEKGRSRFLQEAQILAKFAGEPGIVGIRDFFTENNTAYIVMDYLEGVTLRDYLKAHGTLTFDAAIRMLSPVMNSLQKVHEQELIHRDISPDNIMLLNNGQVKLLDFGAARNVTGMDERSLSVMLKPGFAPEEQYRTKGRQGPWTDVYALSATIYRCITGQNPEESMNRVFVDELAAPSSLGAVITPVQEAALLKGLAVLQKNRCQSVGELLDGFNGVAPAAVPVSAPKAPEDDMYATHFEPAPAVVASRVHVSQDRTPTPAPAQQAAPQAPAAAPEVKAAAPKRSRKRPPAPAAETTDTAPVRRPKGILLILGVLLIMLGTLLLALGLFGYLDERDTAYLSLCATALIPAIPGVLLTTSYLRKTDKKTSNKLCRVVGIIVLALSLAMVGVMIYVGEPYSFYLTQAVLDLVLSYILLRHGFAEHKARKKLNRVCSVGGALLLAAIIISVVFTSLTTVTIGDQRLDRNTTEAYISVDMITQKQLEQLSQLKQLEQLSITDCFLDNSSIEYLSQLTNLTNLNISGNTDITDISGLKTLTKLKTLNVSELSIADISVVEHMPELESLYASGTELTDPTPINGLSNLLTLDLDAVTTMDFSKLVIPSTVCYLYLNDTGISDLSLIATMERIYNLDASGNNITDVSPLSSFDFADSVDLSNNQISDLTGLSDCRSLYLSGNAITDISPIAACTSAWHMDLSSNQIEDISPLRNCPQISYLYLNNNQITDVSALSAMNLEMLYLNNNQITDISALASSISMKYLYINDNQITDISALNNMSELGLIRMENNCISDISPLLATKLPAEEDYLHLENNNITDISPLSQFSLLNHVFLSGNPVTDLSPLASCSDLSWVEANETEVSDISCLSGMPNLSGLEVIRTNVIDFNISPVVPTDERFSLRISYSEDLDLEATTDLKAQAVIVAFYDVPENMLKYVGSYGLAYSPSVTDLYLHPVEEVTEAVDEVSEPAEDAEVSAAEVSENG